MALYNHPIVIMWIQNLICTFGNEQFNSNSAAVIAEIDNYT